MGITLDTTILLPTKSSSGKPQTKFCTTFGQLHGWPMQQSREPMKSKMSDLVILLNLEKFILSGNGTQPTSLHYFY